jgi:hypothetical protein
MKKSIIPFFVLLTLNAMRAFAQHSAPRWSLDLAAGPVFPEGSFHKPNSDGTRFAQTGSGIELGGSYRFWRSFSATMVVEAQKNKGDGVPYVYIPSGTDKPAGSSKGPDWKMARLMAGTTYTLALTKKTGPTLLIRLLGGVQQTTSPDYKAAALYTMELTCANCGMSGTITYPGLSFPPSFAYEADAGLQWKFHSRFAALGWFGYQGSKPSKELIYNNAYNPLTNSYSTYLQRTTISTSALSLRAGVSYTFSK